MTTFLLCIGCQKGGTTWLSEHLRGFPEVRLGIRKEMHVLDVRFVPVNRSWHQERIAGRKSQIARMGASGDPKVKARLEAEIAGYREAEALVPDLDAYARYFRARADSDPGVRLVADLTPDYALLGPQDWAEVRETLERHGFTPKILFLMRDPVSRLESVWRMAARDDAGKALRGANLWTRAAHKALARARHVAAKLGLQASGGKFAAFAATPPNLQRSQFETTIAAVESVFPAAQVHYDFYETLFTPEAMTDLMEFLDLPQRPANFAERVNASPLQVPLAASERASVARMLEPTYRFCAARFGAERIQKIWRNAPDLTRGSEAGPVQASPGRKAGDELAF